LVDESPGAAYNAMTCPVVIVSTGRTGTSFFSRLIGDLYPQAASYHERGFSRPIQILTNAHFAGLIPKQVPVLAWKVFKEYELEKCDKPIHVDSNCFLYGLFAIAPDLYPRLKVIHIVRDPRTYVTSHLNYARFWPTSFIANYFVPFWQPSPFLTRKIPWRRFFSLSRFERYAWIWDFKNNIMESMEHSSTPYLRIRFEDIFHSTSPEQAFARITDFIGLPRRENVSERFFQPLNQAPRNTFPEWAHWTPRQCRQLQALCGVHMAKYDYGNESAWLEKLNG
jgi:hypothetical protein